MPSSPLIDVPSLPDPSTPKKGNGGPATTEPARSFLRVGVGGTVSHRGRGCDTQRHASRGVRPLATPRPSFTPPAPTPLPITGFPIQHAPQCQTAGQATKTPA